MLNSLQKIVFLERAKAVCFDGDGVFTDNTEVIGFPLSESVPKMVLKLRSHYDGQGVSLLRAIGIRVAIITNEEHAGAQAITSLVGRWNGLPSVQSGAWHKVDLFLGAAGEKKKEKLIEWTRKIGVSLEETAVMGDDLVDYPMLTVAGFRAAPSSAEKVVLDIADFVSVRPGGSGAVRDFVNEILMVRGIDQTKLPTQ